MIKKKFKLFECCAIVKGINNGIIIDLQRKLFHVFPLSILNELEYYNGRKIYDLFIDFKESKAILKKYISYFIENELVNIDEDLSNFPVVSDHYIRPFTLDILSVELCTSLPLPNLFFKKQIDFLGVSCLKLILNNFDKKFLNHCLNLLNNTKVQNIAIFINYQNNIVTDLDYILSTYGRVRDIIIFNYPDNLKSIHKQIYFNKSNIHEILCRKINSQNDFTLNIDAFNESKKFNLIYNRTLHIDSNQNVKLNISTLNILGNIIQIKDIIKKEIVQDFWSTNKDKIVVCQDCEFRYICPDGRIPFKKNFNDKYYTHEEECNYNPYENTWN